MQATKDLVASRHVIEFKGGGRVLADDLSQGVELISHATPRRDVIVDKKDCAQGEQCRRCGEQDDQRQLAGDLEIIEQHAHW